MSDSTPLRSTVAVVTGASSGIGEATALSLAALGAKTVLIARRADRLDDLAGRVSAAGPDPIVIAADLADADAARSAIDESAEKGGRIDILVNNAGVMLLGPIENAPVQEWERMIDINLRGLIHCTHAALPHLLAAAQDSERGVADLVNVSSVAGRVPRMGSGVYNLTKHGVGAFSESLRQEVTKRHVRVGLIEPGAVATELAGHNRPEVLGTISQRFANMERMVAEDISEAIAFTVTRPQRVAVNEMLIRPTEQEQ